MIELFWRKSKKKEKIERKGKEIEHKHEYILCMLVVRAIRFYVDLIEFNFALFSKQ